MGWGVFNSTSQEPTASSTMNKTMYSVSIGLEDSNVEDCGNFCVLMVFECAEKKRELRKRGVWFL